MHMVGFPMPPGDLMVQNCVPEGDSLEGLKTLLRFKGGGGIFFRKQKYLKILGYHCPLPGQFWGLLDAERGKMPILCASENLAS